MLAQVETSRDDPLGKAEVLRKGRESLSVLSRERIR